MKSKIIRFLLLFAVIVNVINCAKRGTPTGGEKDTTPPEVTSTSPEPNTTNFDEKKIRINFNEYIKLKDLQKQLIVSPPLKYTPEVTPQGSASKYLEINIKDTLSENTTYVFNFGQSITDNNEGNPYSFYKFVFSTGDYIDSLKVQGVIKDAVQKKPEQFVSVMLYKVDSTFNDSIIYKTPPTYITNTLDSTTNFELTNLKEGKYMLIAMKDVANNYLFNQKTDKIGFISDFIEVPTDSVYEMTLFKETNDFWAAKPSLASKNRIIFGYEGDATDMQIDILSETPNDYKYHITQDSEKDTLHYWFSPFETDSLLFTVSTKETIDTFTVRIKDLYNDTLAISKDANKTFGISRPFKINASTPIVKVNTDSIFIINKDSVTVDFTASLDSVKNQLSLNWPSEANQKYLIEIRPNALEDFFGNVNDTVINYSVNTKSLADLGSIRVKLKNITSYPVIVQLTSEKGEVLYESYASEAQSHYDFNNINPGNYLLRVIFDTNSNKKWDTGNYLKKIQPERISYFPTPIELKANWELEQEFTLK
ncbi:Ig-like domain-containing protein [Abyssalbus ytuae]|uniref:Ig-like domain-containing protein n=1 Tax=Abyssalbus ytuae TaxID=2926907 RepID=A0A9E6ZNH3_9FLAO|nr:Ig-like domain-containing protein [Abyssalbus ytuae]UOB19127.1 Ig-like domain-containing protein [Abyssalbus ytuae]